MSSTAAATTVGQAVINAVKTYDGTTQGKASISVEQPSNSDATITITTRDFEVEGTITIQDGILTWGEIEENVPGVFLNKTEATLNPGGSLVITARKKNVSENITWSKVSGSASITVTEDQNDNLKATINVTPGASNGDSAIIKASAGGYEPTCTITVEKVPVQKVSFNNAPTSIDKGDTVTLTITATDNSNKPATPTSVTFASSDTTVATIGATSGELEGKKAGTTTISVTASDGTNSANASFSLTVNPSIADSIIADSINEKIGTTISYPTLGGATGWKIFYADSKEMFIIPTNIIAKENATAKDSLNNGIPLSTKSVSTVMGTGTYGGKWNNLWLNYGNNEAETGQNRHLAVAYLCDPENWSAYVAKKTGTTTAKIADSYAVGAPTLQLFVESWNIAASSSKRVTTPIGVTAYGYNQTISSGITTGEAGGLYNPDGSKYYWLAAPNHYSDSNRSDYVRYVGCISDLEHVNSACYYDPTVGFRPLVSIPISNVQVAGETPETITISIKADDGTIFN